MTWYSEKQGGKYPYYLAIHEEGRLKGQAPMEISLIPSLRQQWDRGGFGTGKKLREFRDTSPKDLVLQMQQAGINPRYDEVAFYEVKAPNSPRTGIPRQRFFSMLSQASVKTAMDEEDPLMEEAFGDVAVKPEVSPGSATEPAKTDKKTQIRKWLTSYLGEDPYIMSGKTLLKTLSDAEKHVADDNLAHSYMKEYTAIEYLKWVVNERGLAIIFTVEDLEIGELYEWALKEGITSSRPNHGHLVAVNDKSGTLTFEDADGKNFKVNMNAIANIEKAG